MINYRNRPKGNYIKDANWNELYLLSEKWKSDLEFYLYELNFLETLIESHFSELLLTENLDELRELQIELYELKNQSEYLLSYTKNNLECIVDVINNVYIHETSSLRIENEQLEENIVRFVNGEREIKKFIFNMIKSILENKKTKKFWMFN